MSSSPWAAKRLESAVSICLLIILFLIGLAILLRQSDADMSRFGIETTAADLSVAGPKTGTPVQTGLDAFAPAGFEAIGQTQVYSEGNLYEKIDGKADFYTDAGFESLSTQRFVSKDSENLWMELYVYDMGGIRNAFSVYSRQRRPDVLTLPDVQFGYKTANALYFVHGKYYIELVGSAESQEITIAATQICREIRASLPIDQEAGIAELSIFPAENLIPDSFKLYISDTFGFAGLTNTFAGRYEIDGQILTAFFGRRGDAQDARTIAQAYHSFLLESGCSDKATNNRTLKNLDAEVIDSYGTTEIIFVSGPFVAGVHEADNQRAAEKLAETLALRLRDISEKKDD